jgi:SpoVK/Ycf46/Vps4 family AAA+-type ATPase
MLLYGPPGTGKTSIAEDLARSLRKPLITITPSDFLAEGPNEVEARAKVIFAALNAQAECVILFDEIDRLLLDRDALMYHKQSDAFQFMTPSMLVKLKDLRSAEQTIFVIATNFYERIDPAARRTGRVDHRYLVMPPCRGQRRSIFSELLKNAAIDGGSLPEPAGPTFETVLDQTALYGFSELQALVRDAMAGRSPASGTEVAAILLDTAKQDEPTIRIAAYRGRFHVFVEQRDWLTEQEPIEEFVGLLELLEESHRLSEARGDATKILADLTAKIRNEGLKQRAERLLSALRESSS